MAIANVRAIPTSGTLGATASTITTAFDATGVDALLVGASFGRGPGGGDASSVTVTVKTYAGTVMSTLEAFLLSAASPSSGSALFGILLPTTGSNNIILTVTGMAGAGTDQLTLCAAGWSGVASFANANFVNPAGSSTTSPTLNITAASGNRAAGYFAHGDTITGAGASCTARDIANNFTGTTSGGCGIIVDRPGVGGATALTATSSLSDSWMGHGVELVAASGAVIISVPIMPTRIAP